MPRYRFVGLTVLSLVLAATAIQTGWSDGEKANKRAVKPSDYWDPPTSGAAGKDDRPSTVYPLSDLGDDLSLCQWVAQTIPQVIEPGTWAREAAEGKDKGVLSYYAPAKVMVVYHTPAVQAKVRAFLDDLKKSLPPEKARAAGKVKRGADDQGVVPSKYEEPGPVKAAGAVSLPKSSYPVPSRAPQPKHLFHFIIRYEGEGIIDDTVAGVLKELYGAKKAAKEDAENTSCSACPTPPASLSPAR
jgi:hypothetical protein